MDGLDYVIQKKIGGSGGGSSSGGATDSSEVAAILDRTITEFSNDQITTVGTNAFYGCTALARVDLPNLTSAGPSAFSYCAFTSIDFPLLTETGATAFGSCKSMKEANVPNLTTMATMTFNACTALERITLPLVTRVETSAFYGCTALSVADFSALTYIGTYAFQNCTGLTALILRNNSGLCTLGSSLSFKDNSFASGTGYIYVPSARLASYKAASNWSTYSARFRALEDYTVDGTITGELDESKI